MNLRSTLSLTLGLQTLQTLLSSKVWYHLITIELYKNNLSDEFITTLMI